MVLLCGRRAGRLHDGAGDWPPSVESDGAGRRDVEALPVVAEGDGVDDAIREIPRVNGQIAGVDHDHAVLRRGIDPRSIRRERRRMDRNRGQRGRVAVRGGNVGARVGCDWLIYAR